jgi:hypothetical protein
LVFFNRHRQPDIEYILNSGFNGKGENVEIVEIAEIAENDKNDKNGDEDNYNELTRSIDIIAR